MDRYLILILVILVICFLIYTLKPSSEKFTQVSDIVDRSTPLTYKQDNTPSNSDIIIMGSKNDNSPLGTNDPNVIPLPIPERIVLPNEVFKDNKYIRDQGVQDAINKQNNSYEQDYEAVYKSVLNFQIPEDSKDKLSYKHYNEFTKEQLDNSYLADIYDQMSAKVNENISKEELDRITGKEIVYDDIKILYNPVYISIDQNLDIAKNKIETESKFKGYYPVPFGSLT